MQLTSHPFNDMSYEYTVSVRDTSDQDADGNTRERITDERAGRADKFVPYFAQIADIALTTQ